MKDDTNDFPLKGKIIIYAAVAIFYVWYLSGMDERAKEFEEKHRSTRFCNPATAVCVDDPDGENREAWEDYIRSRKND